MATGQALAKLEHEARERFKAGFDVFIEWFYLRPEDEQEYIIAIVREWERRRIELRGDEKSTAVIVELYLPEGGSEEDTFSDFLAGIMMPAPPHDGQYIFLPNNYARPGLYRVLRTVWVPNRIALNEIGANERPDHRVIRCVVMRRDEDVDWMPYRERENPYIPDSDDHGKTVV